MEKLTIVESHAVVWLQPDVDTDIITPMRRILEGGSALGKYSFEAYRFVDGDGDSGVLNMDFPLNQPRSAGAKILITGENFGCGSSRETAAEALKQCGFKVLIGSGFGTIFTKNCFQQGLLPIVLPEERLSFLAGMAEAPGAVFRVDLESEQITLPDGSLQPFTVNAYRRQGLLLGLDDVGVTLLKRKAIEAFYEQDRIRRPWLYTPPADTSGGN